MRPTSRQHLRYRPQGHGLPLTAGRRLPASLTTTVAPSCQSFSRQRNGRAIAALYSDESHFRSQVQMARHGFDKGEYRYCKYPLPGLLGYFRTALYPQLASVANEWNSRIGIEERYPVDHASFLKRCHAAAQTRLTPLLLYVPGDLTVSIRISMAISHFRSRSQFSSPSPTSGDTRTCASCCLRRSAWRRPTSNLWSSGKRPKMRVLSNSCGEPPAGRSLSR
jgi:hypothetical protein